LSTNLSLVVYVIVASNPLADVCVPLSTNHSAPVAIDPIVAPVPEFVHRRFSFMNSSTRNVVSPSDVDVVDAAAMDTLFSFSILNLSLLLKFVNDIASVAVYMSVTPAATPFGWLSYTSDHTTCCAGDSAPDLTVMNPLICHDVMVYTLPSLVVASSPCPIPFCNIVTPVEFIPTVADPPSRYFTSLAAPCEKLCAHPAVLYFLRNDVAADILPFGYGFLYGMT